MRFAFAIAYFFNCVLPSAFAADELPPNILFIIADDASIHFGQAYGCDWVKTPNIDRLAKQGLVFENVYTPTSSDIDRVPAHCI